MKTENHKTPRTQCECECDYAILGGKTSFMSAITRNYKMATIPRNLKLASKTNGLPPPYKNFGLVQP